MTLRLFLPTARQMNWLLIVGFLSLGEALYLRYFGVENSQVALACQSGLNSSMCSALKVVIPLFRYSVFGWSAIAAALLNLLRPSLVLTSFALVAISFGLVLHNTALSGLAAALLMLSLARPAPVAE